MRLPFIPYDRDAVFEQTQRRLPHREQPGCTYFVTWRLADSVPLDVLKQWKAEREVFLHHHPKPWDEATYREYAERFEKRLERWSDEGHGECHFRRIELRGVVAELFHRFDQERYDLVNYVVMPNHVHVLVRPYAWSGAALQPASGSAELQAEALQHTGDLQAKALHHSGRGLAGSVQGTVEYQHSLSGILKQWKGAAAREINKALGRSATLWMDESFDHAVRSEAQLRKFREYVRENPTKAGLREGEFSWWDAESEAVL